MEGECGHQGSRQSPVGWSKAWWVGSGDGWVGMPAEGGSRWGIWCRVMSGSDSHFRKMPVAALRGWMEGVCPEAVYLAKRQPWPGGSCLEKHRHVVGWGWQSWEPNRGETGLEGRVTLSLVWACWVQDAYGLHGSGARRKKARAGARCINTF